MIVRRGLGVALATIRSPFIARQALINGVTIIDKNGEIYMLVCNLCENDVCENYAKINVCCHKYFG